jgi:hypothetical protein
MEFSWLQRFDEGAKRTLGRVLSLERGNPCIEVGLVSEAGVVAEAVLSGTGRLTFVGRYRRSVCRMTNGRS